MAAPDIFEPDFIAEPYWWDDWRPSMPPDGTEPPESAGVAVIGAGFTGLSAALELANEGIPVVVLEADLPGSGASTRNGGGVSGGARVGKRLSGRRIVYPKALQEAFLHEASDAYTFLKQLMSRENIDCRWQEVGRFVGAWTPEHYVAQEKAVAQLNELTDAGAYMLSRHEQRQEVASDVYHGGQVITRSANIQPALLYKGLLEACLRRGVRIYAQAPVHKLERAGSGWILSTPKGDLRAEQVVVATNGYTGKITPDLRRGIVPVASNIIVTEELPAGMPEALLPKNKMINESARIRGYYRLTPDGKRMLFGGRGRFGDGNVFQHSQAVYDVMLKRLPQLKGIRIAYAWSGNVAFTFDSVPHVGSHGSLHYAVGCNGSGVAMMTYLGYRLARKISGDKSNGSPFERPLPTQFLYGGKPWFLPVVGGWFKFLDRLDGLKTGRKP